MLNPGTKVGPYEIFASLGAGGMGEVYGARDTKLGRDVALKVLPEQFARDAERMARFAREAQVLASLNHPNIAAIYDLKESGNIRALVMELVEGSTLAKRLSLAAPPSLERHSRASGNPSLPASAETTPSGSSGQGRARRAVPLPFDESLAIAKQIAEGLEAAHERGIIHRDLKPANLKITPQGSVKLLDFGLAKAMDTPLTPSHSPTSGRGWPEGPGEGQNSPTLSTMATQEGIILGTAAYKSPEQARGKPLDRRADIWAFGCVLFEMFGGKQAFAGDTVSDTLASVLKEEPDWTRLPVTTPPSIQRLVRRCLMKDPKQRLQAIGEARIAIVETLAGPPDSSVAAMSASSLTAARTPPLQRALPWAIASAVFLIAAIVSPTVHSRLAHRPVNVVRSTILPPDKCTFEWNGDTPVRSRFLPTARVWPLWLGARMERIFSG